MQKYLAFLRGINVGGKSLIKMSDLRDCITASGCKNVQTYIQSGNIIFESTNTDKEALAEQLSKSIEKTFDLSVLVAVFTHDEWKDVVLSAPEWWGQDKAWKHNLLILTETIPDTEVVAAIGTLKSDIEAVAAGKGVIYQSMSFDQFGKTTTGKLASNPIYKKMTIRNYNTVTKLAALLT